jgi:hypothetical protein
VERRGRLELPAGALEVPVHGQLVEADIGRNLWLAYACGQEQDDPLLGR